MWLPVTTADGQNRVLTLLVALINHCPSSVCHEESVTVDFITGLRRTASGHDAICIFVDCCTNTAHFAACKKAISAEQTAQLF
jgi:hypothetical protein